MKKTINQLVAVLALSFVFVFTSCSDDDDNLQQEELSEVTREFQQKVNQMNLPSSMASSSNSHAQQATTYFNSVKTLGQSFSALLTVPSNATTKVKPENEGTQSKGTNTGNSKTYTWTASGVTVTYTITEENDRYSFIYIVDGNGLSGKLMDGYQLKDGSYAEFKMYSNNSVVSTFKFWVNGNIVKGEIVSQGFNILLESDISTNVGNIKIYDDITITAEYNWNADGTGWYKNHLTNETFTW